MSSKFATTAALAASLALGTISIAGSAGPAHAAPSGGGVCIVDHRYVPPTTYQVARCTCPPGSLMKTKGGAGEYWCTYPQQQNGDHKIPPGKDTNAPPTPPTQPATPK